MIMKTQYISSKPKSEVTVLCFNLVTRNMVTRNMVTRNSRFLGAFSGSNIGRIEMNFQNFFVSKYSAGSTTHCEHKKCGHTSPLLAKIWAQSCLFDTFERTESNFEAEFSPLYCRNVTRISTKSQKTL